MHWSRHTRLCSAMTVHTMLCVPHCVPCDVQFRVPFCVYHPVRFTQNSCTASRSHSVRLADARGTRTGPLEHSTRASTQAEHTDYQHLAYQTRILRKLILPGIYLDNSRSDQIAGLLLFEWKTGEKRAVFDLIFFALTKPYDALVIWRIPVCKVHTVNRLFDWEQLLSQSSSPNLPPLQMWSTYLASALQLSSLAHSKSMNSKIPQIVIMITVMISNCCAPHQNSMNQIISKLSTENV